MSAISLGLPSLPIGILLWNIDVSPGCSVGCVICVLTRASGDGFDIMLVSAFEVSVDVGAGLAGG